MQVTLCLTHDCTLRCPYCYAGEKRRKAMPWEVAKAAIDRTVAWQLAHYPEKDYVLGFFGGEPLLEWDLLQRADAYAADAARAAGLRFGRTVTTNLTLLDRGKADWLRARRYKLGLSIDGSPAMHDANRRFPDGRGSHAACMAALPLVEDFPAPRPEIICVVTPATAPLLAEGVRFLHARSALPIAVNPDFTADWDDASRAALRGAYESLAEEVLASWRAAAREPSNAAKGGLRTFEPSNGAAARPLHLTWFDGKLKALRIGGYRACDKCDPVRRELAVAPSGNLYQCPNLVGDDDKEDLRLGSVQTGFDPAAVARVLARRGNRDPACRDCPAAPRCVNWCCCANWFSTGRTDRVGSFGCFHEKLSIELADRVAETLLAERNEPFAAWFKA